MAIERIVDRVVEKLPYSDGSARRRFIAGALVLGGVIFSDIDQFLRFSGLKVEDLLGNPMMTAAAGLVIYLTGTVVEMLGSLFLIPVAGFFFKAFQRFAPISDDPQIRKNLSRQAQEAYDGLPERIRLGIERPGSRHADLAVELFPRLFRNAQDKRWARNAFARARDVGAITTALIAVLAYVAIAKTLNLRDSSTDTRYFQALDDVRQEWRGLRVALDRLEAIGFMPAARERVLELFAYEPGLRAAQPVPALESTAEAATNLRTLMETGRTLNSGAVFIELEPAEIDRLLVAYRQLSQQAVSVIEAGRPPMLRSPSDVGDPYFAPFTDWQKNVARLMQQWKQASDALQQERQTRRNLAFGIAAVFPVLLLLYAGYFLSLRHAFLNGVEARAIELTHANATGDATDRPSAE